MSRYPYKCHPVVKVHKYGGADSEKPHQLDFATPDRTYRRLFVAVCGGGGRRAAGVAPVARSRGDTRSVARVCRSCGQNPNIGG